MSILKTDEEMTRDATNRTAKYRQAIQRQTESPTSYRPAIRDIGNCAGPIGSEISIKDFASIIQSTIDTISLRDLIDELVDLYEPTDEMERDGESLYPVVMQ